MASGPSAWCRPPLSTESLPEWERPFRQPKRSALPRTIGEPACPCSESKLRNTFSGSVSRRTPRQNPQLSLNPPVPDFPTQAAARRCSYAGEVDWLNCNQPPRRVRHRFRNCALRRSGSGGFGQAGADGAGDVEAAHQSLADRRYGRAGRIHGSARHLHRQRGPAAHCRQPGRQHRPGAPGCSPAIWCRMPLCCPWAPGPPA